MKSSMKFFSDPEPRNIVAIQRFYDNIRNKMRLSQAIDIFRHDLGPTGSLCPARNNLLKFAAEIEQGLIDRPELASPEPASMKGIETPAAVRDPQQFPSAELSKEEAKPVRKTAKIPVGKLDVDDKPVPTPPAPAEQIIDPVSADDLTDAASPSFLDDETIAYPLQKLVEHLTDVFVRRDIEDLRRAARLKVANILRGAANSLETQQ